MSELIKLIESEKLIEFKKNDEFLAFINQSPPDGWIKPHPLASNVNYLPIDKVELLLKRIFQNYKVEILREGQLLNSIYVTVRLHYKHPIEGWTYQDGTGAVPIQTDKGKNASELQWIKSDAIPKGLPAAVSFAIKDAADRIGDIFGGNINRKDTLEFSPMYMDDPKKVERIKNAIIQINDAKNTEALRQIFTSLGNLMANEEVIEAKDKKKKEIEDASN